MPTKPSNKCGEFHDPVIDAAERMLAHLDSNTFSQLSVVCGNAARLMRGDVRTMLVAASLYFSAKAANSAPRVPVL